MRTLRTLALAITMTLPGLLVGCGGTNENEDQGGAGAEAGSTGDAGSGGNAQGGKGGNAQAGSGQGGNAQGGTGQAGSGVAGTGTAGTGTAGTGVAGSGVAGSGVAGTGQAGSSTAGAGGSQGACKPGESQTAPDGCNTCVCDDQGQWVCTKKACVAECQGGPPPCAAPPEGCGYINGGCVNGQWTCGELSCNNQCKPGETQPAPDGCNTCTCTDNGQWACTEKACVSECTDPAPPCAEPPPGCGYVGGGCVNGQWTCGDVFCGGMCKSDADCPAIKMACQQCPDGGATCPQSLCLEGACQIAWSPCQGGGGVGPGLACEKPGAQAPADDGCNTCICGDNLTWSCTKIACVECQGGPPPCAAPPEGCSYVNGGCVNGQWTCGELSCNNQCKSSADCPQPGAPCQICPDGSSACPSVDCVNGQCVGNFPSCPDPNPCAPQEAKGDGLCDAFFGYAWDGASCNGVSGCSCAGADCKALYQSPDECAKAHADCGGSGSQCKMDSDCPVIKIACQLCPDGVNSSCPQSHCTNGTCEIVWSQCGGVAPGLKCEKPGAQAPADDGCNTCTCGDNFTWSCTKIACVPECQGAPPPCAAPPEGCSYVGGGCVNGQWTCGELSCNNQCKMDSDCPQIGAPCQQCPDGGFSCPESHCVNGACQATWTQCGCAAQEIKGVGDCKKLLGFAWDGTSCASINGCECAGNCASMYATQEECNKAHASCQ